MENRPRVFLTAEAGSYRWNSPKYLHLLLSLMLSPILIAPFASAVPYAKPVSSEGRCFESNSIVLAEYLSYAPSSAEPVDYFLPPIAVFRVIRTLKGPLLPDSKFQLRFDFHDGSACLKPQEWKFDERTMPNPGSKFVLFLTSSTNHIYTTYRGDFGRVGDGPLVSTLIDECLKAQPKR